MPELTTESVAVTALTGIDRKLGYRVPEELRSEIDVGALVRVPLLRRNELAIVRELKAPGDFPESKLKFLHETLHPFPVLTPDLLELADWMKDYYAASLDCVLEAIIPAVVRKGTRRKIDRFIHVEKPLAGDELEKLTKRAPRQAELYNFIRNQIRPVSRSLILKRLHMTPAVCDALVKKGALVEVHKPVERLGYDDALGAYEHITPGDFELNDEQKAAAADFIQQIDRGRFGVHLLHGVTGSGKTEVYIRALKHVLNQGGGAIYLVPEVALTPQTVGWLRSRLEEASGTNVVVWHSHLSDGERFDAWHALATGKARVVVGARSAVFAPIRNLRLLVVDEEHEPAYKQEETPRYHGRDVAVYRAKLCGAVCVLGSATPALESLYNAEKGKYKLNLLPRRVDDRKLPVVHIVDMKLEILRQKRVATLSDMLVEKMRDRFDKREQCILFLNRRGYAPSMLCPDCGYVAECDHCSLALTYHRSDERLRCHLCGSQRSAPQRCPQCNSVKVRWRGLGTQRVEEVARKILPKARIVRIDADAMHKKDLFRQILADFRIGKIDVLVGTQMIAKGLDFPNVTLVGLIDADLSLHIPDFRASERCFQLLVQVAGRAGRGDRAGEVVAQSFLPHSAPIQYARQNDVAGFTEEELNQRREFRYPPFRHLIHHLFRGKNPDKVAFYAEHWARKVESQFGSQVEVRGPAPAPREKVKDYYRYQVWYFVRNVSKLVPLLVAARKQFPMDKAVIDVFDVDPVHMT